MSAVAAWWWRLPHVAWLAAVWVALWGDARPAVWLAGGVVGVFVLAVRPRRNPLTHTVRPVAAARLAAAVAVDIVRANLALVIEVLTPQDHTAAGVIDVRLPSSDPAVVAATSQAINLAPGTVVVDQPAPDVVSVHALYLSDPERVDSHIQHLARLADAAFVPHWTTVDRSN